MESVSTKEMSNSLAALSKHKNRANKPQNVAVQPVAIMMGNPKIEVQATSVEAPVTVTPNQNPEPNQTDNRDYKESWKEVKKLYDTEIHKARETERLLREELAKQSTATKFALPKTKEEMDAYRKQYPEAMDVFQTLAMETVNETSKELKQELDNIKQYQADIKEKEAFKKLLDIHPDAMEIKASPKFLAWYNEQPYAIQDILAKSSDINAVAKQLTLYKLEVLGINPKEQKKNETQSAIDASLGVDIKSKSEIGTQKKIWTGTEINAICADYNTYLKYRVEIDDARREGRVDMSK